MLQPESFKHQIEREIRDMAFLPRWAIVRTIRTQSVAEHSYMVAMYTLRILAMYNKQELQAEALEYALTHDLDEVITGDIPNPVKRGFLSTPQIKDSFKAWLDSESALHFPWLKSPNAEVKLFVAFADILEAYTFLLEECRMGNSEVLDVMTMEIEPAALATGAAVDKMTGLPISTSIITQTRYLESTTCSRLVGRRRVFRDLDQKL